MEEIEIPDFDVWIENFKFPEVEYVAVFDPETGVVNSVGPSFVFENQKHTFPLDTDIALQILEGTIPIHSCFIDTTANSLEIAEVKSIFKIDDVIHRIISKEWSEITKPDVVLFYDSSKKTMKFQLSEEYGGTYKLDKPVAGRKIRWDGDTVMNFLITDYNDPNVVYNMISVKLSELVGKSKIVKNIEVPKKYSVYTRRLFKNYIIDHK
jgi:hypothetical protein